MFDQEIAKDIQRRTGTLQALPLTAPATDFEFKCHQIEFEDYCVRLCGTPARFLKPDNGEN